MKKLLKYGSILLGAAIIAFGMYNIHARCAISEGGVLGLVLLLRHWFHISPGIGNFVIDVAAMVAGALILKKSYLWDSLVATIGFSVCYEVMSRFPPLLPDLSTQPVLAAVLGGLFVGVGTILIVRHGCAAGADDTFALLVNHKTHIKLSTYYFLSDFTVLLLSLTYISPIRIWWSVLSVVVSSGLIAIFCPEPKAVSRPETKQNKRIWHNRSIGMKPGKEQWAWTRPPKAYSITEDRITMVTEPHTDLWQRTYYHFRNDNAPVLQLQTRETYFSFVVRTAFDSKVRFDQCGVVVYLDSENWLKASIEFENGIYQHLGSVVTNQGYSDWATTEIDAGIKAMWYRLSRREDDFCLECSPDGVTYRQMRICHMAKATGEIRFGVYACSPEDSSFTAEFTDMELTECRWKAHDGQAPDAE